MILLDKEISSTEINHLIGVSMVGGGDYLMRFARTFQNKVAKAQAEKILIQLQAIYNIPDLGAEDVRMGEFIQELMEEVNG